MGKVLIDNISDNFEAWIAQKQHTIGSGDISTIAGANDYQTPLKLWAIKRGKEQPDPENDFMWWGQMMERPIAQLCGRRLGIEVEYGNKLFGADVPEWATATPDYFGKTVPPEEFSMLEEVKLVPDTVIVECKNVGYRRRAEWALDTPLAPRIQVMWQLGVTGIKRGIIAPLIGGDIMDFAARWVEYDQKIFEQLLQMADRFMWHVRNDVPPPPKAEDTKLVDDIIGRLEDQSIELEAKYAEELRAYKLLKDEQSEAESKAKAAKDAADEIKNKLRFAIGANRRAVCGPYSISCTPVNVKEKITKAYSFVRFTVKEGSQDESD